MIKVCTRCIMDNASDKTITFSEDDTCNYCNDTLNRINLEYFPNETGKKKWETTVDEIKEYGKDKKYDCMVGLSGGVDSSYIIYLGHKYGLRMLVVHLDDELDTEIALKNVINICSKAKVELIYVKPDMEQYKDLLKAFFSARVPNLALVQDNIIAASLNQIAKENNIKYVLNGANFSLESILERGDGINSADLRHIKDIHNKFGNKPIDKLNKVSLFEKYVTYKYCSPVVTVKPLNYIDYNLKTAIEELNRFSDYTYYGGKHYESILTRFMQCYYLPVKFGIDKRKSHYSSMIVSGQLSREEALELMKKPLYTAEELMKSDIRYLANYFGMSEKEFIKYLELPRKQHKDYKYSHLNDYAWVARKFRRFLG